MMRVLAVISRHRNRRAREDQVDQGLTAGLTVRVLDKNGEKIARYDEGQTEFPAELRAALRAFGEKHPDARFIDVDFAPSEWRVLPARGGAWDSITA